MPDDLWLEPGAAVRLAQRLIDEGRPFHAHEVLEAVWKSAQAGDRALWKGLAQITVGLTHARRGNAAGAVTLLRRGAAAVAGYQVRPGELPGPAGLDLHALLVAATALADQIAARGLDAVPPDELRLPIAAGSR